MGAIQGLRVTKYDPRLRDARGAYLRDDWSSVGDVGRSHGGRVLTMTEYLRVEAAYVDTAMDLYVDAGSPPLIARDIAAVDVRPRKVPGKVLSLRRKGERRVSRAEMPRVVRACLRELSWCRLEAEDASYLLHFGYDYYMYVSGVAPSEGTLEAAAARGIFVEACASPYMRAEARLR